MTKDEKMKKLEEFFHTIEALAGVYDQREENLLEEIEGMKDMIREEANAPHMGIDSIAGDIQSIKRKELHYNLVHEFNKNLFSALGKVFEEGV